MQGNENTDPAVVNPPVDAKVTITLLSRNMVASMSAARPQNGGRPLDAEMILAELAKHKVSAGVDEAVIARLAANPVYGTDVTVAKGVYPEDGADGFLTFHIQKEASIKPAEREDGTVDYHELGIIQHVQEGQLLVEKTPPTNGVPGYDLFNNKLPPKRGRDPVMPAGSNTTLSGDGLRLSAAKAGHVEYIGGRVTVYDTFTIKEDVSNATGNINFNGNVVINGSVLSGFVVAASGSITIRGACEAATIRAGGSVTIGEGMNGGVLEAAGEIKSKYLQSSNVTAGSNVYTGAIINCSLRSGGSVVVSGSRATIAGGSCSAAKSVESVYIGSKNATVQTRIEVGLDPVVQARLNAAPKELQAIQKTLNSLEQVLGLLTQLEAAGRLDEDKAQKLQNVRYTMEMEQQRQGELQAEMTQLEEKSRAFGYGTIIAKGSIAAGVKLVIGPHQMELQAATANVRATRGDDGISIGLAV